MLVQLKKKFYLPLVAMLSLAIFFSCKKNINDTPAPTTETPDLTTKINSSVSGFVTDENNAPVQGATVKVGSAAAPVQTDEYGYFEAKNVEVVKNAAVVTVSKTGYFNGIKTYAATPNKAAFFRIKLLPKTIAGTINASSGGNVTLSNGLIIGLPANPVVKVSGNTAYTGNINVAVQWLNPEANDLTETMPGDLRGLDEAGAMKGLTTFGMAAVELTSDAGELLQIASDKKATITMPLSGTLSAAAPASIPLWHFDESNGLWKQEGSATKTGNTYVGEVSHFSWWNCDLPNATVPLTFTVVDNNGTPVANAHVEITPTTSNSWSHVGGWTDGTGYVSVFVTPNTTYDLEIFSNCNSWGTTPDYSQSFSVTTTAVDLGNIAIPTANSATLTGSITDCSGSPVTNGNIIVQQNGYFYSRYPVDNTGSYNFSIVLCNGTTTVNIIAEDIANMQQSNPVSYTITAGANNIGNIQACGVNTTEFINYTVDGGTANILTAPGDSLYQGGNGTSTMFYISGFNYNTTPYESVEMSIDNNGIAPGSTQNLLGFSGSAIMAQTVVSTPIGVHITEYGPVGGYIAGNFSGTINDASPPNTAYNISCSFRVRRNF